MFSEKVEKEDEDRLWMKGEGEEEESEAKGGRGFRLVRIQGVRNRNGVRKRIFYFLIKRFSIIREFDQLN